LLAHEASRWMNKACTTNRRSRTAVVNDHSAHENVSVKAETFSAGGLI
jgi:hypothetical protein